MYARLSSRLLSLATPLGVASALLPSSGCASSSGELAIPSASADAPTVATAAPPPSALPLPPKEPRDAAWEVPGGVCMPAWATNVKAAGEPAEGSSVCGPSPGDWVWQSKFAHRSQYFTFSTEVSRSQTGRGEACCYEAHTHHVMRGRPLEGATGAVLAETRPGAGWSARRSPTRAPLLAAAWQRDALEEHASIAAFSALALDLLALGAPASLVAAAHEAALDEVRHAELCFSLAARFGASVEPAALALPPALLSSSRVELARRSIDGGCVGEALAALEAFEAARASDDAEVRAALETLAADEARHAELAVRVVVWAMTTGSAAERAAIAAELLRPRAVASPPLEAPIPEGAGRLSAEERARIQRRGLTEVALPTLRALAALAAQSDATPAGELS